MLRQIFRITRSIIVAILVTVFIVIPGLLWVGLSLPFVVDKIRLVAQDELSKLLGTEVRIGEVSISPFSEVSLHEVSVGDPLFRDKKILEAEKIAAGIDIWDLLEGDITVTFAELIGMNVAFRQDSVNTPINLMPIIERFKKDEQKEPTHFRLAINTVVIRNSTISYDILSAPAPADNRFCREHIVLSDFRADATLPLVSDSLTKVDLRRLAFNERSGLSIKSLSGLCSISKTILVENFKLQTTSTSLDIPQAKISTDSQNPTATAKFTAEITPSEFAVFYPPLEKIPSKAYLDGELSASTSLADISLKAELPSDSRLNLVAHAEGDFKSEDIIKSVALSVPTFDAHLSKSLLSSVKAVVPKIPDKLISSDMTLSLKGDLDSKMANLEGTAKAGASQLVFDVKAVPSPLAAKTSTIEGRFDVKQVDLATWVPSLKVIGPINGKLQAKATVQDFKHISQADIEGDFTSQMVNNYVYNNLSLKGGLHDGNITGDVVLTDPNILLTANVQIGQESSEVTLSVDDFRPNVLFGKSDAQHADTYGFDAVLRVFGSLKQPIDSIEGHLALSDISIEKPDGRELYIDRVDISTGTDEFGRIIAIDSDMLTGSLAGHYGFKNLVPATKALLFSAIPGLASEDYVPYGIDARLHLNAQPDRELCDFFKVPLEPLVPIIVNADLNDSERKMSLVVDAPYIRQKNKLIEGSHIDFELSPPVDSTNLSLVSLSANTLFPAKKRQVKFDLDMQSSSQGTVATAIDWNALGDDSYKGNLRLKTFLDGIFPKFSHLDVEFEPGEVMFNDTVWTISPASIHYQDKNVSVNGFKASHAAQEVSINGEASASEESSLVVNLSDFNLDYLFETLNINAVTLGGNATGTIHADALFSPTPKLYTDNLQVKGISYNGCVVGDADIKSGFDIENKTISIDADIVGIEDRHTYIYTRLNPFDEELNMRFVTDKAPVGFLQPFMKAFCKKITGYATGDVHLGGTFRDLDVWGDVYGEDIQMAIDFTGVTYTVSDSVKLRPGKIILDSLHISDPAGNKAILNGKLTHRYFNDAAFDFHILNAKDFLCYDQKETQERPWYGQVYGTGNASIIGRPGLVEIGANMQAVKGTDFSFVLSDMKSASEYTFITFRDKTPIEILESMRVVEEDTVPIFVREMRRQVQQPEDNPTAYSMNFNIDLTPEALLNIVMDPIGGDKIKSQGTGNISMAYDSSSEDLKMYGTYNITEGSYNFTLQDFIRKNFTIEDGSSITFHGDPYNAQLNIKAHYAVNANLTDLDDSFATDNDINRTKVPVHAMLYITDDMRTPEIAFDITFPTLDTDVYRKVRSIVASDEMMNQQIIYLLALNRFYTPEYISATRGGDLVSVASSTISSRLSSMLSALTDKISIAPSIRSSRGDFTDVEFDVELSSRLLNNRLLLNGVLGYRDPSMNTNSFVGDFDIEYLLNRAGTWRLKAYNRFNDQNSYLRTSLTTQGVGVTFKFDFK